MAKTTEPTIAAKIAAFAEIGVDENAARAILKQTPVRSFTALSKLVESTKTEMEVKKVRSRRSSEEVDAAGRYIPGQIRGHRFGPVWLQHVAKVDKLVLRPAKLDKLVATAKHVGLEVDANQMSQEDLARAVSKQLIAQAANLASGRA